MEKGQKHKKWTEEEKYKIIKPSLNMEISTYNKKRLRQSLTYYFSVVPLAVGTPLKLFNSL